MSAPTPDAVAPPGGGGRFDIPAGADPASVLAAVRRGILVCADQLSADQKRVQPVLASGSPSEFAEAVRAASLAVDEAAAVISEAEAVLRLWGLKDDDTGGWSSRRDLLEVNIMQARMLMDAMERVPPESRWSIDVALGEEMSLISTFASNWCRRPAMLPCFARQQPSTSTSADDHASGIEAVQVSEQE